MPSVALTAAIAMVFGGTLHAAPAKPPVQSAPSAHPAAAAVTTALPANATRLSHGRFQNFLVYSPSGVPKSFVLLLSGQAGLTAALDTVAQSLVARGAMVAALDYPGLRDNLDADVGGCVFPDGDLENLSHFVQAYFHVPTYLVPLLAGESAGATLAYATLVQAPSNTFAAALTTGFCPQIDLKKPLCEGSGIHSSPLPAEGAGTSSSGGAGTIAGNAVGSPAGNVSGTEFLAAKKLDNPWVNLAPVQAATCDASTARSFVTAIKGAASVPLPEVNKDLSPIEAWLPQFDAAFGALAAHNPATAVTAPPTELTGLPLIDIPPAAGQPPTDEFAIVLSGDGGWAGLDKDVAAALTAKGIPVVGLDSLRYFWSARTPEGLASDLDRTIRYYLAHLDKKRVLLVGYSQGADVLPFAVNRLSVATRSHVALTAILGMSEHALFEFHVTSWISDSNEGPATLPEVDKLHGMPVLCIYGAEEDDSLCPKLDAKKIIVVKLKGGHHFDGDYAGLAREILNTASR